MRNMPLDAGGPQSTAPELRPVAGATIPYWRNEPHAIDEHRSTEMLPYECDIAIIGAGLSGVSTAYHLSKLCQEGKPSIVMLEARQVCSGATGRNGGHVKIQTSSTLKLIENCGLEDAEAITAFVREHIYALKEAVETEGLDCEFEVRRSFDVFMNEVEASKNSERLSKSISNRESWTRDVGVVLNKYVKQITSIKGALAATTVPIASFWPYKFVSQLLAKLVEDGFVNLQTWTPVLGVMQVNQTHNMILTGRGTLMAKKVLFATNAYSGGVCPQYENKIVPYIGTACHISPMQGAVSPHLAHTYNINYAEGGRVDYLNPRPDGGIVVGGGNWTFKEDQARWYNNWDDSQEFPEVRPHFDGLMQRHFNGWQDSNAQIDQIWTGVQGSTADGLPHVGVVPETCGRQFILAGFNGGGNAFCFLSALGVAKMVGKGASFKDTGLPRLLETTNERLRKPHVVA